MEDLALSPETDGPYDSSADHFYEEIEAPKFVDLTDKDPVRVDDRYWFCSRVGCDQKHEEELDSEEVYKKFVLRVMAARSPNVRLQSRRGAPIAKCPLSCPPKSTRPAISRLGLISSSVAKRLEGFKSKCSEQGAKNPVAKKSTVVAAKYMTTPRNRNVLPKQDQFHSVQNPKGVRPITSVGEAATSRVAKALVFQSPKKPVKLKASLELKTPVRKVCEKLKKLVLDEESRKKRVLGYSPKSVTASKPKVSTGRPWRVEGSRKGKNVGLEKTRKRKSTEMSQACESLEKAENHTGVVMPKSSENGVVEDIKSAECFEECSSDSTASGKDDAETGKKAQDIVRHDGQELGIKHVDVNARDSDENKVSESPGQLENQEVPHVPEVPEQRSWSGENQVSGSSGEVEKKEVSHDTKAEQHHSDDDKENESAPGQNICKSSVATEDEKVLGQENTSKKILQVTRSTMTRKGVTAADAQVQKLKKPKPTNPKPFRLRTDERGILKEASDKRVRSVTPMHMKEKALQIGKSHGEIIFKNDKNIGSSETKPACKKITKLQSNRVNEINEKPRLTKMQKPSSVSSPLEHGYTIAAMKPKSILSSGKPNRDNITRKPTVSFLIPGEKTPEISSAKEAEKPSKVYGTKSPARARSLTPTTQKAKNLSTWRLP